MTEPTAGLWRRRATMPALIALGVSLAIAASALTDGAASQHGGPEPTDVPSVTSPSITPPEITTRLVVVDDDTTARTDTCGPIAPFDIDVPGAVGKDGPAPGIAERPSDHQFVRHWTADGYTVEVRWPPDPRPLQDVRPTSGPPLVGGWGSDASFRLTVTGPGNGPTPPILYTIFNRPERPPVRQPWACSLAQVRLISDAGTVETYGYRLPLSATPDPTVDLGPLVGPHRIATSPTPIHEPTICSDPSAATVHDQVAVQRAPIAASPAEALRAFLDSEASADVPNPVSSRPYEETHFVSDGSYRYEHYVAWYDYVTITVQPFNSGWAVTDWQSGTC